MPTTPDYTSNWGLPKPKGTNLIAGSTQNLRQDVRALADKTDQSLTQVYSFAEDGIWSMSTIRSGDHLDNYFDREQAGIYPVASGVEGTPTGQWGALEVMPQGNAVTQRYTTWLTSGQVRLFVRTTSGGAPTAWSEIGGSNISTTTITDGHLNDYRSPDKAGYYRITNVSNVGGLPVQAVGVLIVVPMTNSNIQFYAAWFGANQPQLFMRTFSGTTPSEWFELTGGNAAITIDQAIRSSRGVIAADKALAIFNARLMQHTTQPVPIVFAGSSTTEGNGAPTPADRWVNRLVTFLQNKYPSGSAESTVQASKTGDFTPVTDPGIHGYNIGRGGTQADDYLTDGDSTIIAALEPALIIHMVGSNDYARRRSISAYKADLEYRIAHLSSAITVPHVHVLAHQFERKDITAPNPSWEAYAQAMMEIAEEQSDSVAHVNVSDAFGVTGTMQDDPFGYIGPDNVHTTVAGHQFLAHLMAIGLGEK